MTGIERERLSGLLAAADIVALLAALNRDGEEARIVGGAVRNALLGEPIADIDVATTCLPEETMRRARAAGFKAVPTGVEHGTVTVVIDGTPFEVTTLRRDVETDGRHAVVAFGRDFREDALRRDFTINALGLDAAGALHDYADGLADLAMRRVRFIGAAGQRIAEDYLRILRFFRFHARYGIGEPDPAALDACIAGRAGLEGLSRERVWTELRKLLAAPRAAETLQAMAGAGLLMPVIGGVPRLSRFAAIADEPGEGVYPAFRLAALAVAVSEDALRLRERLRLSNAEFERVSSIAAALEALSGESALPEVAHLRRLAHHLGADAVAGALVLLGTDGRSADVQALIAELARTPPFLPTGRDVLGLGVSAGPKVGQVLEAARENWIEAGCPTGRDVQLRMLSEAAAGANG
ncbi:Poly(A) polymerase [Bosea sp. 62]|uniref:CCA tRNA nucleotidyltransferase n=1 Tax=unclassified Bosea (in: a-proteobacteria) TaxID=2653178 RepID=UPI0012567D04|nr:MULTISPECIES: CCA tRNA nucleotidyltransferase [unclassified Bosea (in: a-proteobacteria)]CAD5247499.1 Poly(A) polymerase [Bosea sp. 46]CAD5249122.1 Poly(A) polymerase [Bosea sp. 21B]CAD5267045.1 Poly(A) polymerase [Bosea sp. 7B]VVT45163.1 Poly(A) polymerase [Bosea sp. EC-HK365B]VXA98820.1 Poly(A) polymerase [Bosea sp. 29B]